MRVFELGCLLLVYLGLAAAFGWGANEVAHKGVHVDIPAVLSS